MISYLKPNALKKGDLVAIVSPSSTIQNFPKRIDRAVQAVERVGFRVVVMLNALANDGYSAGTARERADDINAAFLDNSIKGILCSTGGLTANAVLPFLDYESIKKNPKVFCGFSDITTLLLALLKKCEIIVFHGPTLLPSFGDFEGPIGFTEKSFFGAVSGCDPIGITPSAAECAAENLYWERDDNRALKMKTVDPAFCCGKNKDAEGVLIGGNLQTLSMLLRTEYFPDIDRSILFLEEESLSTAWYEGYLIALEQDGIFNRVVGIVLARPSNSFREEDIERRSLLSLMDSIGKKYGIPVLMNVDCGHTKPIETIPLGLRAVIHFDAKKLEFIESAIV